MSIILQHKITKIIKKNWTEYHCENHGTTTVAYPDFKSLQKDHPNLEETLIEICDLREISINQTLSFMEKKK